MKYSVLILAAGKGSRTQLDYNKVFYRFKDGTTVLEKSVNLFLNDCDCEKVILVCAENELDLYKDMHDERIIVTIGGNTRQESVYNGLKQVTSEYVFIHDGARPFITKKQIEDLKNALENDDACLLMVPSVDTTKIVENGYVKETMIRSMVYNAQTPQCFKTELIQSCHDKALLDAKQATDDTQLVEWYSNVPIKVVLGDVSNKKITYPGDLEA